MAQKRRGTAGEKRQDATVSECFLRSLVAAEAQLVMKPLQVKVQLWKVQTLASLQDEELVAVMNLNSLVWRPRCVSCVTSSYVSCCCVTSLLSSPLIGRFHRRRHRRGDSWVVLSWSLHQPSTIVCFIPSRLISGWNVARGPDESFCARVSSPSTFIAMIWCGLCIYI